MEIRPYKPEDIEDVLDIWYRASIQAHPFLGEAFHIREKAAVRNEYLPLAETWICQNAVRMMGFVSMTDDEITGLFVAPEFQRGGVGRFLMDHAQKSRPRLEVDVFKENWIGRQFYAKHGFRDKFERPFDETGDTLVRMEF